MAVGRHNDMAMIRSAIHGVEVPCSDSAVAGDRFIHDVALPPVQKDWRLSHLFATPIRKQWLWEFFTLMPLDPAAFIAGEPRAIAGPCNEVSEWVGMHDCRALRGVDLKRHGASRPVSVWVLYFTGGLAPCRFHLFLVCLESRDLAAPGAFDEVRGAVFHGLCIGQAAFSAAALP